jgi:hypothetical protein
MAAFLMAILSRFAWFLLVALAAFVIFVECIADVGGDDDPIREPAPTISE